MYRYYIYGLKVWSEIRLYRLEQCEGKDADVFVRRGSMDESILRQVAQGINSAVSGEKIWFRNETGIFMISEGKEIVIQQQEQATEEDLASFVLGWCISFLFLQRKVLAIHCSALEMHGQAVLISGVSGAGKSTTALSLLESGYRYLADDIAMVDLQQDLMIYPAFPQQKVCRNVAENIQEDSLFYINEQKDKFAYINNKDFCDKPRRLTTIFLLDKYEGEKVECERLMGLDKWNGVMRNLFLLDAYRALGFPVGERERCLELAGRVEMYIIRRPERKDTVGEICKQIIDIVKRNTYGGEE